MVKDRDILKIILLIFLVLLLFFSLGFGMIGYYGFNSLLGIIALVAAIWVIYDVFSNNKGLSDGMKIFWVICAIFLSILTAIIYYFFGRSSKNDLFRKR